MTSALVRRSAAAGVLFGANQAVPARGVHARRDGLGEGGHVGQRLGAVGAEHADGPQPAGADVGQRARHAVRHQPHRAGEQVRRRRPAAAVVDHVEADAGAVRQQLGGHVRAARRPGRRHVELARPHARLLDEALRRRDRALRVRDQDERHHRDVGDGREVALGVVADPRQHGGVDRHRPDGAGDEGVAVVGACRRLHRRRAGAAAAVLHDDGVRPAPAQLLGDEARDDVGALAGREGHDQPHRPLGPGGGRLGQRRRGEEAERQRAQGAAAGEDVHGCFLRCLGRLEHDPFRRNRRSGDPSPQHRRKREPTSPTTP